VKVVLDNQVITKVPLVQVDLVGLGITVHLVAHLRQEVVDLQVAQVLVGVEGDNNG